MPEAGDRDAIDGGVADLAPWRRQLIRPSFPTAARLCDVRRRHPLLWFVLRRLATGVVLVFLVSLLVFVAMSIVPGDAAGTILGKYSTPESLSALRHQLGLDQPPATRFLHWLWHFVQGDFGRTATTTRAPVWELVQHRVVNTLTLALVAAVAMVPLAIALGTWAGIRAGRPVDQAISGVSLGFIALPDFVVGAALILLFAVTFRLLPPISLVAPGDSPLAHPSILVLPVATVLISVIAYGVRMVRAGVIEVMASDYVQMARLDGIPERRVIVKHGLRNALAPSIQVFALIFQYLAGGVFIVETLFSYPGIGYGLVQAVQQHDYPYVQSVATLIAGIYIFINIVADLTVVLLVPKLRTAQ